MFVQSSSALTFKQELKMWYEAIKLRDRSLSKRYYQTIKDQVTGIEDIDILASFHLVSDRHFLLSQLYNDAKYHLTRVKHYVSCLSNELSAYYYYFNGLYEYLNGNIQQALNDFSEQKRRYGNPNFIISLAWSMENLEGWPYLLLTQKKHWHHLINTCWFTKWLTVISYWVSTITGSTNTKQLSHILKKP